MHEYEFEICDEDEFPWEVRHKVVRFTANSLKEAMEQYRTEIDQEKWSIYQVCRKFEDCKLAQPIWDFFNGSLIDEGNRYGRQGREVPLM